MIDRRYGWLEFLQVFHVSPSQKAVLRSAGPRIFASLFASASIRIRGGRFITTGTFGGRADH